MHELAPARRPEQRSQAAHVDASTPVAVTVAAPSEPALAIPAPPVSIPRPIVQPTAPERYRVQFTIGAETHEKLRRVQALLCREIPDGDPGAIFDRALTLLLEKVEKAKIGVAAKPQSARSIRPGTDKRPRRTPNAVRHAVWRRDGGQCGYVSPGGHRCTERNTWSSTTFIPTRGAGRPPSTTSRYAAGDTTNTRPS
jgi:hypothetical protein